MLSRVLQRDASPRRLRFLLSLLFLALAAPTAIVVWQAYGRLEWESFHQYRSQAEELTRRIDAAIGERVAAAEARSFTDYAFVNVGGSSQAGVLQRSVLSAFPVEPRLPGLIGYFQVDAEGRFSTPLLPASGTAPEAVGIAPEEYDARLALTREIRRILADNRLVGERAVAASVDGAGRPAAPAAGEGAATKPAGLEETAQTEREADVELESALRQGVDLSYAQRNFDELGRDHGAAAEAPAENAAAEDAPAESRASVYGKVQDLRLDEALNRKSEVMEEAIGEGKKATFPVQQAAERARRLEQSALPEPADADLASAALFKDDSLRITAFESEVDPFEFSLLGSGHFVLFRKVWRDGERYVQGALVEQGAFLDGVAESAFRETSLHAMSDLVVAYRDDVVSVVPAAGSDRYAAAGSGMQGALLYRSRLSAPLDTLELIYSVRRLPPGPGSAVLGWATLLLAAVLLGGFFLLYRLGMGQIALARQQQDFVSAVSHELKTPLTSIRMYGEMLQEGWVDEDRRQQYYAYIHDEAERLSRLIDNVLRLASISRNGLSLDLRTVTAQQLVDRVRVKIAETVERAGFELSFEVAAGMSEATLELDEDCFTQIVINLVDNAIKFSRDAETRRIDIAAVPDRDGRLRFSVRDYGPGVPGDQMRKIFRLFYRTESELTRETVGTGIGLAIVHQLATAMSGKVDVVNRSPGAEFGIAFPMGGSDQAR